jgi:peptidyl-prolyl cis-trans isomerase C
MLKNKPTEEINVRSSLKISTYLLFIIPVLVIGLTSIAVPVVAQDSVLAKIGNRTVTEADLNGLANAVPEKYRELYLTPEGRKKSLEYVVNIYVLAAEAEKQGLDKSPDIQKLMDFTQKDLLARIYLDRMGKDLPVPSGQDASQYFEKFKDQFTTPESVHLRHILVNTEKEAKSVLERLKKGEKFADIAGQVSICPSKAKGGDLDWLPRGSLVPEIEDVAFSIKNGQITGPVKSKFGYHILLVEDKKPAQEGSFDMAKDYIFEQLKFQAQQDNYEKLTDSLRKKMNVQILLPPDQDSSKPVGPAGQTSGPK